MSISAVRFPAFAPEQRTRWRNGLPQAVEIALVLLLAVQAARLLWMLAVPPAPIGDPGTQAPAGTAMVSLRSFGDPFFRTASAHASRDAALGYRLFAVRGAPDGGSAILAAKDGVQAAYRVGDAVADGIVLQAVGADYAILRTGGGDHRLSLQAGAPMAAANASRARPATALPSARPAPASVSGDPVDARRLLSAAGLRPQMENGRVAGYALIGRGDTARLRQAGFEPGDVLVAVNGRRLNAEVMAELERELASRDQAHITVQRNGGTQTITLRTKQP